MTTTTKPKSLKRAALVSATLAFSACSLHHVWMPASQPEENWTDNPSLRGRSLSLVGVPPSNSYRGCRIPKEFRLSKGVTSPSYLASFHGGGKVLSNIVQALTGIATTNQVNFSRRRIEHTVLFETHYPLHKAIKLEDDVDADFRGTILLLRNPIADILSSFNAFYAHQYHYLMDDVRAPEGDWIRYRDSVQFAAQVKAYERFVTYWMNKYKRKREDLLLITYEGLTGGRGAIFTKQIGNFLQESKGVNVIDENSIQCVWEKFVHDEWYQDGGYQDGDASVTTTSFQERSDDRPFTQAQLRVVSNMLRGLERRFGSDEQFSKIMNSYLKSLEDFIAK